jgi:hypothetical protein
MANESPTSTVGRAGSTTPKIILTIGLLGVVGLLLSGRKQRPTHENASSNESHGPQRGHQPIAMPKVPVKSRPNPEANQGGPKQKRDWLETVESVCVIAGTIIGVVGLIYLIDSVDASKEAAVAAKDAVTIASTQMITEQRAWITVTIPTPAPISPDRPLVVVPRMKNIGQTAAKTVDACAAATVYTFQDPTPQIGMTAPSPTDCLATELNVFDPDQERSLGAIPARRAVAGGWDPQWIPREEGTKLWAAGRMYILVTGRVTYTDVFGIKHWSQFCAYFSGVYPVTETSKVPPVRIACTAFNDFDSNTSNEESQKGQQN